MIKVMSLIKRKEGMNLDAYRKWALDEHPKLARNIPGMKRYQVDVMVKDDPANPFDSVSEMWFESEEAMAAAFATDGGKAAGADAAAHASNRVRLVTKEHPQFGH
jgi:uncharacterized protein (TIGR02118 family)